MEDSLADLLRDYPAASFIVGVVALVSIVLPSVSKSTRDAGGLIGSAARKVHEWRERAIEEDQQVTQREIADLRSEIDRLDRIVSELQVLGQDQYVYIVEVTHHLRAQTIEAAAHGWTIAPFPTFPDWRAARHAERDSPGD
ncbi:hypothetical protein [Corynebacterium antarcticum]|uniref:hypothetical protein n=1 Tax=Corynebacterium antarcticum TaxID=2800405 RepID=UPI00200319CA|nr:hypothetical protein [Corynebacterium antarcticum]MCK7661957.1 hypothetical protein [Corynebacterium antarcticum]